jgi:hypothetical protein
VILRQLLPESNVCDVNEQGCSPDSTASNNQSPER